KTSLITTNRLRPPRAVVFFPTSLCNSTLAGGPPPPNNSSMTSTNDRMKINWRPYPAAQQYKIFRANDLYQPFVEDTSGSIAGFDWESPLAGSLSFYRLQVVSMDNNALLVTTDLNRLPYGPTTDELKRVT